MRLQFFLVLFSFSFAQVRRKRTTKKKENKRNKAKHQAKRCSNLNIN